MKALITIILATLLTACGSGKIDTVTMADTAIEVTQPDTITPPVVEACSPTSYVPCDNRPATTPPQTGVCNPKDAGCVVPEGMEYCDNQSYNPCQYPTWIPKKPEIMVK